MSRLLAIVLLVLVAGCATAPSSGSSFVLDDGSIVAPATISNGTTTLEISNVGEFNHTLVVTDSDGNVLAATDVIAPGTDANLSVDLQPGAYRSVVGWSARTETGTSSTTTRSACSVN